MINFRNILKMLFLALLVCTWSDIASAKQYVEITEDTAAKYGYGDNVPDVVYYDPDGVFYYPDGVYYDQINNQSVLHQNTNQDTPKPQIKNDRVEADFCSSDQGLFSELVRTGQKIFYRLRDLIYVVAGFGIIAVAVGGFFGNLNWKWLGAIVISLVVIATAGELIVLMTGCEQFSSSLITNTLTNPAPMSTEEFNAKYTEEYEAKGYIEWDDSMDVSPQNSPQDAADTAAEATMGNS